MKYKCDCGREFSDLLGLDLCQTTNHGQAKTTQTDQTNRLSELTWGLITLSEKTRQLQRNYYKVRNQTNLVAAKEAESKLDKFLENARLELSSIQSEIAGKQYPLELPNLPIKEQCEFPECGKPAICSSGNVGGALVCSEHFQLTNGKEYDQLTEAEHKLLSLVARSHQEAGK